MKKKTIGYMLGIIVIVGIIMLCLYNTGIIETRSAVRIGYVGNSTMSTWTGRYVKLDGTMQKKLAPKDGEIKVDIVTESGSIGIRIEGADGTKYYQGSQLETSSFTVKTEGKVNIKITADNHEGSFSFK